MKKKLPIILLIGFVFVACTRKIKSDSYWLAIDSYPIPPNKGNSVLDGAILHFEEDSVETSNIYFDYIEKLGLTFKGNKIFLNDTLTFTIFKNYADSVLLDFDINTRTKFVRLNGDSNLNENENFFKPKQWLLTYDNAKYQESNEKLFLTDLPFYEEKESLVCISKSIERNQFLSTPEKWKFRIINGAHLFVKTRNQLSNEFYKITEYLDTSTASLKCINCQENITATLRSIKNIDSLKKREILKNISNGQWRITDILELDTISTGSRYPDSIPLRLNSLKNKDLKFIFFNDSKFKISESGVTKVSGNWKLSTTGQEIILNEGLNPSDYLDLINVTSDSLTIGNLRIFESEGHNYGMDIKMYYKVRLKK